jgi:thiamine-monophosphate kinase
VSGRGEFDLIADMFAPLASSFPGALGLKDDAALLKVPDGFELVTTVDAMVEGVHFSSDDAANLVAQKLLRVNLSDLAAMGATPLGYLLTLVRPSTITDTWLERFAHGLADDQRTFGISLLGGDTVSTQGPLVLSLTAMGQVESGQALRRSGARPGDDLYVSGTIGDASLGLELVLGQGGLDLSAISRDDRNDLVGRLQCPEPRLGLGKALKGIATSATDISDGLIADLSHIATASECGLSVDLVRVPVSPAAERVAGNSDTARLKLVTGGEDYELAFTASRTQTREISGLARKLDLQVTRIGRVTEGTTIDVRGNDGEILPVDAGGYSHF